MKLIATLILIASCVTCFSQNLFKENSKGTVEYSGIIYDSASKDNIYGQVKVWIAKTFINPIDVIKLDDKESGLIKLTYHTPFIRNRVLYTSLLLEISDNKVQYTFDNIYTPVEKHLQDNMTAEGINKRVRERINKKQKPDKFLTSYVLIGEGIINMFTESLKESLKN